MCAVAVGVQGVHPTSSSTGGPLDHAVDGVQQAVDGVQQAVDNVEDIGGELSGSIEQAETTLVGFFNDTRSKFEQALVNLSSYLPISVEYALNVSHLCDPVQYNKQYYHTIAVILSAALILLGVVFAFVGESVSVLY